MIFKVKSFIKEDIFQSGDTIFLRDGAIGVRLIFENKYPWLNIHHLTVDPGPTSYIRILLLRSGSYNLSPDIQLKKNSMNPWKANSKLAILNFCFVFCFSIVGLFVFLFPRPPPPLLKFLIFYVIYLSPVFFYIVVFFCILCSFFILFSTLLSFVWFSSFFLQFSGPRVGPDRILPSNKHWGTMPADAVEIRFSDLDPDCRKPPISVRRSE